MRARPTGFYFEFNGESALEATAAERASQYETFWERGGLPFLGAYGDLLFEKDANDTIAEFGRQKIRDVVDDPSTADLLCPADIFGGKRLCVDSGYFQTYNLPHVSLVDISERPIERLNKEGIVANGSEYPVDAIVCATGFAAMTGSFDNIKITGRDGLPLTEKWRAGPRTYLGLSSAGFPNMFMITGPGSPSVLTNMLISIEQHVDWTVDCIVYLRENEVGAIEPTAEAEDNWVDHVNETADATLYPLANSWYMGDNIPGKPRVFLPYVGGVGDYRKKCDDVAAKGYEGFTLN